MTAHDATPLARRTVLRGLAGATAAGALGTGTASARRSRYHVVQGDRCLPIEPLSGDRPVEEVYDMHLPEVYTGDNGATDTTFPWYGSLGTQSLQRENTTITFLYDGPEGLSLVVVHGKVGETDGDGGRGVSWTLTGTTLADGDWVVKDDLYRRRDTGELAATNYDRWDLGGTTHTIDWTWGDARTDGGAFRSLGDDFAVTIDPAYNETAALWDANHYDGRVTDWEVLSFAGDEDRPERYSLALDETVTLQSGPCVVDVSLDVRSRVQPDASGAIPVVLSGPAGFDVRRIDPGSLRIGAPPAVDDGGGAMPRHGGHVEDVDGDGTAELVVHVPTPATGFTADTTTAKVVGRTTDGRGLIGTGAVRLAGSRGRSERGEGDDDEDDGRDENDGEDGDDGRDENDGEDGDDGRDENDGEDGDDGRDENDGEDGDDGRDENDGEGGDDGRSGDDSREDDGRDGNDRRGGDERRGADDADDDTEESERDEDNGSGRGKGRDERPDAGRGKGPDGERGGGERTRGGAGRSATGGSGGDAGRGRGRSGDG